MEGWVLWCCCVAVAVMTLVKSDSGDSLQVNCWVCPFSPVKGASCPKDKGTRYQPSLAVTNQFCANLRNNKAMLKYLCSKYPNGYHLVCERVGDSNVICKNDHCPAEPEHQTGNGASQASCYSHHASGFLFMAVAVWLLAFG